MAAQTTVKFGDTHNVSWRINADLTGATVTGFVRLQGGETWDDIEVSLASPGVTSTIEHELTGTLAVGRYDLVLKAAVGSSVTTAPTAGYHLLIVTPNGS